MTRRKPPFTLAEKLQRLKLQQTLKHFGEKVAWFQLYQQTRRCNKIFGKMPHVQCTMHKTRCIAWSHRSNDNLDYWVLANHKDQLRSFSSQFFALFAHLKWYWTILSHKRAIAPQVSTLKRSVISFFIKLISGRYLMLVPCTARKGCWYVTTSLLHGITFFPVGGWCHSNLKLFLRAETTGLSPLLDNV